MSWTVQPWVNTLMQYKDQGTEIVLEAAKDEERFILDTNREQLYNEGTTHQPQSLGQYAASTVQYKARTGQRYDHVTLRDSGDFHASFFIVYESDKFTIYADDEKTALLVGRYGPEILGLTPDSLELLVNRLREAVVAQFRKKMLS